MRHLALLALLAGCPPSTDGPCQLDSECGGAVCARDGNCTAASLVRTVHITWTVHGGDANSQTCATMPDLFVQADGDSDLDTIAYAPVPCDQGVFTFDKLPTRFRAIELGVNDGGSPKRATIDASNAAHFDL